MHISINQIKLVSLCSIYLSFLHKINHNDEDDPNIPNFKSNKNLIFHEKYENFSNENHKIKFIKNNYKIVFSP